ncbi:MAG: acetyl-CoA C-acyltransferase [Bacteroidota bacterium]|nr:acetyl-CoA C-acyltransferase [Bacteroidota bacterium]MDP4191623.1 acetyl-CoA C-acyltransferase [Bacteroidota bacterium]MDP4196347.1 acetyl-CoA C-acyltransferase [Bacteroidota bacterium]
MKEAYIVSAARTAVGKAFKGSLRNTRPEDMAASVITEVINRVEGLKPEEIDDVYLGCAMPEGEQGLNFARLSVLRAGLPYSVPAITINRFCSSGLQTISFATERIISGQADVIIAGGSESMSMVPMSGVKFMANPYLADHSPDAYISMGLTAENVARKYNITRQTQDSFALGSHMKAIRAIKNGKFKDEIVPIKITTRSLDSMEKIKTSEQIFDIDEGPREDTSIEKLSALKPVFAQNGTVTAGNSSQTSDGAAAVIVMSGDKMKELGLKPLARLVSFSVGGVAPEVMGIGPVVAVPKALKFAGLNMGQIDLIELNEAFASQSCYVMQNLEMDEQKVNVNGGAIALGHPLGCTGAKLTVSIINEARRRNSRFGMVTMCIGGGMGAAGIFEFL